MMALLGAAMVACASSSRPVERRGEEIVVCGEFFPIGTPVVLWHDAGGYSAYHRGRWFGSGFGDGAAGAIAAAGATDAPAAGRARFGERRALDEGVARAVSERGWTLEALRRQVDQIVIHYDAAGTSRACFRILHDVRGLSAHFLIDLDGTIYQTLDVRERAWHATIANDRSVGIELANIGAFPEGSTAPLARWYARDGRGSVVVMPPDVGGGGVRGAGPFRPARDGPIAGTIQGKSFVMEDFTPQQYGALAKLTAALRAVLPRIEPDYPRDASGRLVTNVLSGEQFAAFRGVLGHFHVQENKIDPGPAFDWDAAVGGTETRARGF